MNKYEAKVALGNEYFNFDLKLVNNPTLDFDNSGSLSLTPYKNNEVLFHYDFNNFTQPSSFLSFVTGSTYDYSYNFTNNTVINKNYLDLSGGFLQGKFKGFIPLRTAEGFTLNFWMNFKNYSVTGNTINNVHPSNKGYFFFMGTKSENISGSTKDDVNGIGFFYKDNKIGYKNILVRDNLSGGTMTSIGGGISSPISTGTTGNSWTNITIIYKRNQKLTECCNTCDDKYIPEPIFIKECDVAPDFQKGKLTILVNARPVLTVEIEETIFRDLVSQPNSNIGYNISIGGGTQGLIETIPGLFMENNFAGTFNGGISIATMYERPLTIPEVIKNFYSLKDIYKREENFGGAKIIINNNLTK